MTTLRPPRPFLVMAFALLLGAAGCSGGAPASSTGPDETPFGTGSAAPSGLPGSSGFSSAAPDPSSGGDGAGTPGDPGTGAGVLPADPTPVDPGAQEPTLVIAKPGQLDVHPVGAQRLQASVDGRHVLVKITWTSGVEPCNVLDSVRVDRSDRHISITIVEGSSSRDAMCIEIAMIKATIVDLGDLEPGTWTITSPNGEAQAIEVTVA
jgi:hypothetical protein